MATLASPVTEIGDFCEWWQLALRNRWTGGLVVAPPTESRVLEGIECLGREQLGGIIGLPQAIDSTNRVRSLRKGATPWS